MKHDNLIMKHKVPGCVRPSVFTKKEIYFDFLKSFEILAAVVCTSEIIPDAKPLRACGDTRV